MNTRRLPARFGGHETDVDRGALLDRPLRARLLSPFVSQKLGTFVARQNHEDLLVLTELVEAGKITPVIDRTYPLREAPKAIRYVEEGHARGKVVISV